MPFEKGNSTSFKAGHPNFAPKPEVKEARKKLKAMLNDLLIDEFDNFKDALDKTKKTSPKAFCKLYVDMLAYSLPKISTIAFGADDETQTSPAAALLRELSTYKKDENT